MNNKKRVPRGRQAIVLLSGGLDSAVALYFAKAKGYKCSCLIFDYGQLHRREIESAKEISSRANCDYKVIKISLPWKGSSLLDKRLKLPLNVGNGYGHRLHKDINIPNTYVPGRNIIFLSFALSYAEAIKAEAIFIGAHAQDYSGYPDCRREFYQAFSQVVKTGTKAGVEGRATKIIMPLINMNKAQIIKLGNKLKVPFSLTWSCYKGGKAPCGHCDSCRFRQKGFQQAGLADPAISRTNAARVKDYCDRQDN